MTQYNTTNFPQTRVITFLQTYSFPNTKQLNAPARRTKKLAALSMLH
jgi:hypothetical protein